MVSIMHDVNIMLDLETLSTERNAVVVSIGAVVFHPRAQTLGLQFYAICGDLNVQQYHGRHISAETFKWWCQQSDAARQVFRDPLEHEPPNSTTDDVLADFSLFYQSAGDNHEKAYLWGNGADFDNEILRSLYESFGHKAPWDFRLNRCFRTLKGIFDYISPPVGTVIAHNALHDATFQARYALKVFRQMHLDVAYQDSAE